MFKVEDRVYDIHDPSWKGTVVDAIPYANVVRIRWDDERGTELLLEEDLDSIP